MNVTPRVPPASAVESKKQRPLPEIPGRLGLAEILPKRTEPGTEPEKPLPTASAANLPEKEPEKALPKLPDAISPNVPETDSIPEIKQPLSRSFSSKTPQPMVRSPIKVGRGELKEKSPVKDVWSHRKFSSVTKNLPTDPVAEFDEIADDIVPRLARFEMKVPFNRESHAKHLPSTKFNPRREKQASETPRLSTTRNRRADGSTIVSPPIKERERSADQKFETPRPSATETPDGLDPSRMHFFRAEAENERARASIVPPKIIPELNEGGLTVLYRSRRDDVDEWLDSYVDELKKIIIPKALKPNSDLGVSAGRPGRIETLVLEEESLISLPGEASVVHNEEQIEDSLDTESKKFPNEGDELIERTAEFSKEKDRPRKTREKRVDMQKQSEQSKRLMHGTGLTKVKPETPADLAKNIRQLIERNPGPAMGTVRVLNALYCAAGGGTASIDLDQPEARAYMGILSDVPDVQRYYYLNAIFDQMGFFLPAIQRQDIRTSLTDFKPYKIESQLKKIRKMIERQLLILEDPALKNSN